MFLVDSLLQIVLFLRTIYFILSVFFWIKWYFLCWVGFLPQDIHFSHLRIYDWWFQYPFRTSVISWLWFYFLCWVIWIWNQEFCTLEVWASHRNTVSHSSFGKHLSFLYGMQMSQDLSRAKTIFFKSTNFYTKKIRKEDLKVISRNKF